MGADDFLVDAECQCKLELRRTDLVQLGSSVVVDAPSIMERDQMKLHLETIRLERKTVLLLALVVHDLLHNVLLRLIVVVDQRQLWGFVVLMDDVVHGQPCRVVVQLSLLPLRVVCVRLRLQR